MSIIIHNILYLMRAVSNFGGKLTRYVLADSMTGPKFKGGFLMGEGSLDRFNDFVSRNMEFSSGFFDRFKDIWDDYPKYNSQIGEQWFNLMQQSFAGWKSQQESFIKVSSRLMDEFTDSVNKVMENSSALSNSAFDNIITPTMKGFFVIYQTNRPGNKSNVVEMVDSSAAKTNKDIASKKVQ